MRIRGLFILIGLLPLGTLIDNPTKGIERPATAPGESFHYGHDIAPLLNTYCVKCHSGDKPKGDLRLDFKDETAVREQLDKDREFWQRVAENVRSGEMPPKKKPQPSDRERLVITQWIDRDLLALDCTSPHDPGHVTARRLNKAEYNNTVRDLLNLKEFNGADDFPADDRGYGFDNNGDVLSLSPVIVERYLKASDEAIKQAFRDPAAKAALTRAAKGQPEDFADWQAKIRLVIEDFAPRAYRRPVSAAEIDRLMAFAALSLSQDGESRDKATMLPMRAALMSPDFLFRIERDSDVESHGAALPLNEFELANRLSYFLWSSMPDDELFRLAREKKLREGLDEQVHRMLRDPKAKALTQNFAGQWLEIRGLGQVRRDPALFPAFTPGLLIAMKEETERFFEAIVHDDLSIMNFLDSDFTFLNGPLAKHYGIANVEGDAFRRVALTSGQRGGLLTQASILTITSNPTRTSPVKRGKWILENIFNTPPPPPPPNVPSLEEDSKKITGTLRQVLEKHRADSHCISCHERMDPLGLALENYDATGAWRVRDGTGPVDPSGSLMTGETFKTPGEFRAILSKKQSEFRRGLSAKMLTYALGRGLEYYDTCAINDICAEVAKRENRFSGLVMAIVKSRPFQYRKGTTGVH
jgi:mono/diheme cytochrome c family protein